MRQPHTLYASSTCGGCRSALEVLKQDRRYVRDVEVLFVNQSMAAQDEAIALGLDGVPTLVVDARTPAATKHVGALAIMNALHAKYPDR